MAVDVELYCTYCSLLPLDCVQRKHMVKEGNMTLHIVRDGARIKYKLMCVMVYF